MPSAFFQHDDRTLGEKFNMTTPIKRIQFVHPDKIDSIGVSRYKLRNNWVAYITADGKRKTLGYFDTELEAYNARVDAENELGLAVLPLDTPVTQELVKTLFHYNTTTGELTWKVHNRKVKAGTPAATKHGAGYKLVVIAANNYLVHRVIFLYMTGELPPDSVDHINGDRSDNRWCNLRLVSHAENCRNRRKPTRNTSGTVGVYYHKKDKRWHVRININNKMTFLGGYKNKEDAIKARKEAERLHGYHPNHGRDT
jgi:hypothetical protein